MASKWALEAVDLLLRQLHEKEQLQFGGTIMVLGGDFRQVLPVVIGCGRYAAFNNSIKQSELWPLFKIFKLTQNMRLNQGNEMFRKWLLDVDEGNAIQDKDEQIDIFEQCTSNGDLFTELFGDDLSATDFESLENKIIL
ncbi:MAG: hypothetical protein EZS28_026324, partial [Streblomastix strix]